MREAEIVIKNKTGIHARPATVFVSEAAKFKSEIKIDKSGRVMNAKSLIGILSLGISEGEKIKLIISGIDEDLAYDKLTNLLENIKD
jgi:phosphotransferase system HPr (HPr) family protein